MFLSHSTRLLLGLMILTGCPAGTPGTTAPISFGSPRPTIPSVGTSAPQPAPTAQSAQKPAEAASTLYLSYDDSASTAAVELTKYALSSGTLPDAAWARPWEFFNYESFATTGAQSHGTFQVSMGMWNHGSDEDQYDLGIHVMAPTLDPDNRKNLVLTAVVDVSGSMDGQTPATQDFPATSLIKTAQIGLKTLASHLKPGDVINLVKFSNDGQTLLDNFIFNGTNSQTLISAIDALHTEGGTNLNAGLDEGYRLAQSRYDASKINRVLLLTDAYANIGEVNPQKIAEKTKINNLEGIYFSGLGFGADFNEAFLNELTEAGKGSYFSVVTPQDVKRAFGDRLLSLIDVAARNVQFKLDYPASLTHQRTASEEHSSDANAVQTTNFAFNSAQFFLEGFQAEIGKPKDSDQVILTISFRDPDTNEPLSERYTATLGSILGQNTAAIQEASLIQLLTDRMANKITDQDVETRLKGDLAGLTSPLATQYRALLSKLLSLTP